MYRSRLKVKTLILLCMTGVLMILALRRDPDRKGETGEELLISEEEGGEETGEAVGQEKIWTSPGRNAKIRVLLLDQGGSIYHKEKDAGSTVGGISSVCGSQRDAGFLYIGSVESTGCLRQNLCSLADAGICLSGI